MPKDKVSTRQTWEIAKLKPHPVQDFYFADPTPEELSRLAQDIKKNGLQHAPEILPDGTILRGHTRIEALKKLKHTKVEVIVQTDLAEQGEQAVLNYLIDDNLNRRQMSPLEFAKCIQAKLEGEAPVDRSGAHVLPDKYTRAQMAKAMDIDAKKLQRLLRILKTPKEVQDSYSKGQITQCTALAVSQLSGDKQEAIACLIREWRSGGTDVSDLDALLKSHLSSRPPARTRSQAMIRLRDALRAAAFDFSEEAQMNAADDPVWHEHLELFRDGQKLLGRIVRRIEATWNEMTPEERKEVKNPRFGLAALLQDKLSSDVKAEDSTDVLSL